MNRHLKKLSEETLNTNPWWAYKKDEFEIGGEKGEYYYGENNGSVIIVPVLDDGRLILVVQHRYLRDKLSIEFPCGGINGGEAIQNAAEREFFEETGYKGQEFIKLGVFDPLNGLFKDTSHVFLARGLEQIHGPQHDTKEHIEVLYRRPDEIDEMIRKNEIWDGQTMATWAMIGGSFRHAD